MDHLVRLVEHMIWADERAVASLRASGGLPTDALERMAHILAAAHVWLSRLEQRQPRVAIWPKLSLDECAALAAENARDYRRYMAGLDPSSVHEPVTYRNSAGQELTSLREDIFLQVATHGSYHRGQISLLLRAAGFEPAPTDYIAFVRGVPAARTPRV